MLNTENTSLETNSQSSSVDGEEINLIDLLTVIIANLRLLVLGPVIIGLIALGITFYIPPTFTAKTTMIPPGQKSGGGAAALLGQLGGLGDLAGASMKTPADQYIAYLESTTLSDQMIEKFHLQDRYETKFQETTRKALKANTKFSTDKKSGLITIEVMDKDPQFAADMANSFVDNLSQMIGEMSSREAKNKREMLEQEVADATHKTYQSPFVREAIIQSLLREYEMTRIEEKKEHPFLTQVDVAQAPELKTKPQKAIIALISGLATGFLLLIWIFIKNAMNNAEQDPESQQKLYSLKRLWRKQFGLSTK